MTRSDTAQMRSHHDSQSPTYQAEHMMAWLMALVAIGLGVIGVLRGFEMIGTETTAAAGDAAAATGAFTIPVHVADGMLWLLPAISAGLLALTLHRSDHHLSRHAATMGDAHEGMWKTEHLLAYLFALITIGLGALALLVGFDVFDRGNTQADGFIWAVSSIGSGVLTSTLHSVRNHQMATDEDYIIAEVERRARVSEPGMATTRETGPRRTS